MLFAAFLWLVGGAFHLGTGVYNLQHDKPAHLQIGLAAFFLIGSLIFAILNNKK